MAFIIPAHKILDQKPPRKVWRAALALLITTQMLTAISVAKTPTDKDVPDAPSTSILVKTSMVPAVALVSTPRSAETHPLDTKFFALTIASTGSAFADSYTTLFARQNWLAGKKGVCNVEVESAYLYGTHPTVARSYAVASVKSASAIAVAYFLRKRHSKLWSAPLAANAIISLQGVTQNMITCN